MFILLLLLLLLLSVVGRAEISVNPPVSIVNGRSLRLDINHGQGSTHARVERVIACSAIDMPFFEYDPKQPETSGCNSSGYVALEIYSRAIALDPAGSLASKFRVRLKQHTILMRRHLLDRRAPLVRLQIHFSIATTESIVKTVYYRVDELALPIDGGGDANQTGRFNGISGGGGKNVFGSAIADDGIDDDLQYTGVAAGERDPLWYTQTLGIMFIFAFGVCVALLIWYRVSKKLAKHPRGGGGGSNYQQNHYDTIASFLNKASVIGLFSTQDATPPRSKV
jgi:hypothetical protein